MSDSVALLKDVHVQIDSNDLDLKALCIIVDSINEIKAKKSEKDDVNE